jgi:hypothetical protein
MSKNNSNFQDLEKQLAKDALEEALKNLHGEITKDIEKNKATFSQEIQKTLYAFKGDLEDTISKELDQKISSHLKNNFLDISTKVTTSFYESSSPFLQQAEEDLQRLHRQGEETLSSWKAMMKQFSHLWNKPFMLMALACILTGAITSVLSSYLLVREDRKAKALCEASFYGIAKRALEAKTSKSNIDNKANTKTNVKAKKK